MDEQSSRPCKTFKGGLISFGRPPDVECIIRSLSATGASIEVKNPESLPDSFMLIIRPEIIRRSCKVAWREEGKIGVHFG